MSISSESRFTRAVEWSLAIMTQSIVLAAVVGTLCTLVYIYKNVICYCHHLLSMAATLLFLDLTVFFGQLVLFFISLRNNCVNNVIEYMSVATSTTIVVVVVVVGSGCCWFLLLFYYYNYCCCYCNLLLLLLLLLFWLLIMVLAIMYFYLSTVCQGTVSGFVLIWTLWLYGCDFLFTCMYKQNEGQGLIHKLKHDAPLLHCIK